LARYLGLVQTMFMLGKHGSTYEILTNKIK
jgi:hypothetical protein